MKEKKLVAYQVDREDLEGSVIVFDSHGLAARRRGANMLDMGGDDEYCKVRRVKEYDQYAEKGYVPVKVLLEDGWWMYSAFDGHRLTEGYTYDGVNSLDGDDYDDGIYYTDQLVFFQNEKGVWMNWDEMERHAYAMDAAHDRFNTFVEKVTKGYPTLTFTEFTGGYGYYTHTAKFTFPGAQYGGTIYWEWQGESNEMKVYVSNIDTEAFDKYMTAVV